MDAIMTTLVAVLLAHADGRSGGALSRLLDARGDPRVAGALAAGSVAANALAAAVAGSLIHPLIDARVAAFLAAVALGCAAASLLARRKARLSAERLAAMPAPLLALRLLLAEAGGRTPLLIAAFAAMSGAGLWAAAGGMIGWTLAALPWLAFGPALADRPAARAVRWAAAAALGLWSLVAALRAFGIIA